MIGVSKEARTLKTHRRPLPIEARAVLNAGVTDDRNRGEEKRKAGIFIPARLTALFLVRPRGLEPPLRLQNQHLKLARLPIPPWPQWLQNGLQWHPGLRATK